MPRTILHADMDAFYAAVEQRDDPRLVGRPVVVGGLGRRGVVSTASYEARRFGVHSAMPTAIARKLCPDAVFVPARMEVYAAEAARIRALWLGVTPLVEPLSLDEAFLDVTGSEALFGDGEAIAVKLKQQVRATTGLVMSVGVAASKFVAKVASDVRKPDGLVVVRPGTERAFLAPLPVRRLWGVGPTSQARLEALGWRSIGDLQRAGLEQLVRQLGPSFGGHLHRLAHGIDDRAVETEREAQSISHEVTFAEDLVDPAAVRAVMLELAEAVGRRLRRDHLVGRLVRLKLRFPPFITHTRQRKLAAAVCDDLVIHATGMALLQGLVPQPRPIRLLGIGVSELRAESAPIQAGLFGRDAAKARRVLTALDAIRDRFGEQAIGHGIKARGVDG